MKILFIFLFFGSSIPAYDNPNLIVKKDYSQKVQEYNTNIHKIHLRFPIPLPYYGSKHVFTLPKPRYRAEEFKFLNECMSKVKDKKLNTDRQILSVYHLQCNRKLSEWKSNLSERRKFHREFCKNSTELAYLDYNAYRNPLTDPYETCKELREEKQIESNIERLQVEINKDLKPFPLHKSILIDSEKIDPKHLRELKSILNEWEEFVVRLGLLDVYWQNHPYNELENLKLPEWDEFLAKDELLKRYRKIRDLAEIEYSNYLRAQIYKNGSKYNGESLDEVLILSKELLANPFLDTKSKGRLSNVNRCLIQLSQKNPNMSMGFYLGFFKRYAKTWIENKVFDMGKKDPQYEIHWKKIQILHWRKNLESELFTKRLGSLDKSCRKALSLKEDQLTLNYFLDIMINAD